MGSSCGPSVAPSCVLDLIPSTFAKEPQRIADASYSFRSCPPNGFPKPRTYLHQWLNKRSDQKNGENDDHGCQKDERLLRSRAFLLDDIIIRKGLDQCETDCSTHGGKPHHQRVGI
eukprot:scaffold7513_cov296-Pinguiococcus_pyrenoidosus.AAC.6